MERVVKDWQGKGDNIYLYTNDSVLDFYPSYGFKKGREYVLTRSIGKVQTRVVRLDLDNPDHREIFRNYYYRSNHYSSLIMLDNYGLLIFYCGFYLKDRIYYLEREDLIAIVDYEDEKNDLP